jgi:hypothetical protein
MMMRGERMDLVLTILFYVYLGLALSAPLLVFPALLICRKLANPLWKGLVVLIPLLGLPLFSLILDFRQPFTKPCS